MSRKIRFSSGLANKVCNEREYSKGKLNNLALFKPEGGGGRGFCPHRLSTFIICKVINYKATKRCDFSYILKSSFFPRNFDFPSFSVKRKFSLLSLILTTFFVNVLMQKMQDGRFLCDSYAI